MKPDIIIKGRIPSKKNSRQQIQVRGRTINIPSKDYLDWHKQALVQVFEQTSAQYENVWQVVIEFWMPDNRKTDLTNKAESVMDLLVDCKILKDDCWQQVKSVLLNCNGIDKENPRAEIWIQKHES